MCVNFRAAFREGLDAYSTSAGALHGEAYAGRVDSAVQEATALLNRVAESGMNKGVHFLKGDLAEAWHAGTLKMNAAAHSDQSVKVDLPRDHSPVDVRIQDSSGVHTAQIKYYRTPDDSAKAISHPKFAGVDQKVIPADQVDGVREHAARQAARNAASRPDQARQYQNTADTASDRLRAGNSESTPLTEARAREMAEDYKSGKFDPKKYGLTTADTVQLSDLLRESGEAALNAAMITAALKAAPHLWKLLRDAIERGEIDPGHLVAAGRDIVGSSSVAALRGGIAACITGACKAGLLGETMKGISPAAIGAGTAVAINAIGYAWKMAKGEMSAPQLAEACLRDSLVVSAGVLGASIGQVLIPIPVLGALIGNMVGSIGAGIVYQGLRSGLLAVCVEHGWTLFGLVEQDYRVPEEILDRTGYRLVRVRNFEPARLEIRTFSPGKLEPARLSITPLQRGLVRFDTVGYLPSGRP